MVSFQWLGFAAWNEAVPPIWPRGGKVRRTSSTAHADSGEGTAQKSETDLRKSVSGEYARPIWGERSRSGSWQVSPGLRRSMLPPRSADARGLPREKKNFQLN